MYPNTCLETDQRRGFGPESIAIRRFESGTVYYYGVLNYNQGAQGVPPLRSTGAHLELYDQTGELMSFDVPQTGDGNFWYVFSYAWSPDQQKWVISPNSCVVDFNPDIQNIITETLETCP